MKDSKFIELLNLYVDHQISPADAALLETEVRTNPDRRRVYREYCMMQKACAELAETFRGEATSAHPKLVKFPSRARTAGAMPYFAGLAAVAACAALVFGVRARWQQPLAAPVAAAPAVAVAPVVPVPLVRAERPQLQPVFGPGLLATNTEQSEQAAIGDWMNSVQLSSLPDAAMEDLRFDAKATLQPAENTYRNSRRPIQGKVEWTAFTFQK